MKMLRIFIGDWRRPTGRGDVVAAFLLAAAALVRIALDGVEWWSVTLLAIGLVGAAVLTHDLVLVRRRL
jgi:hypothetical protein